MAIRLNDCDAGKCITRTIGRGGGLKISTFLGSSDAYFAFCRFRAQKSLDLRCPSQLFWTQIALAFFDCHFRAQKSLDFQGPPLPRALVMDVACVKIIMRAQYKQQVH
jgi:hypothetical protein